MSMSRRPFTPDFFTFGIMALGVVLLLFPAMRVSGLVALIGGVAYWLVMGALRSR